MVVEDQRQPRVPAQPLARDPRREVELRQIDGDRADRRDGVETELDAPAASQRDQARQVVQHAGGRLAMDGPEPLNRGVGGELCLDIMEIEDAAPRLGFVYE